MNRAKKIIILIALCILSVPVVWLLWLSHEQDQSAQDGLALKGTFHLLMIHMERNNGSWPRSWDDMRAASEKGHKADPTIREGTIVVDTVPPIENIQKSVEIDWKADPKELVRASPVPKEAPFRVIWLRNLKDKRYARLVENQANNMILDYLKAKEKLK